MDPANWFGCEAELYGSEDNLNFLNDILEIIDNPEIMSDCSGSPQPELYNQEINYNLQNEYMETYAVMDKLPAECIQHYNRSSDDNPKSMHNLRMRLNELRNPGYNRQEEQARRINNLNLNPTAEDLEYNMLFNINVMPMNLPLNQTSEFEKRQTCGAQKDDTFILPRELPNKINVSDFLNTLRTSPADTKSVQTPVRNVEVQKAKKTVDKKAQGQQRQIKYKHRKTRDKPNNCYHLWTFLEELLDGKLYQNHACVEWTDEQNREFRIINTKQLATLWGQKKGSENMTYDKLSRTFRYYCTYDILKKINGKRLQFKFGAKRMWSKDS